MRLQRNMLLMLVLALLCGGMFTGCFDERHSLTDPTVSEEDPFDEADSIYLKGAGNAVRIVAVGDSITCGYGSNVGGYPTLLRKMLRRAGYNVIVENQGVPGEKTPWTYQRFPSAISGADIVLLMIGVNDIVNPSRCPDSRCRTSYHIGLMLDIALRSGVTPLVSTVTPAKSRSSYVKYNPEIKELNSKISREASKRGVILVDNYRTIYANGGDSLFVDRLHFNDRGYKAIASAWYKALTRNKVIR
ncbi:lipolytic enzyme, G-D-S-L [Candidatus Vecturithrix granuli]|uniref:Lipolytic enzyme, G-D-S-L n=1 Tax=Vecturithrix granuli TaxID=1499967 RepID=A0A081C1C7_VECG1|nr:lipolytic enzyme, G-D-S-L [Candidatus Vecturithrix granuli]